MLLVSGSEGNVNPHHMWYWSTGLPGEKVSRNDKKARLDISRDADTIRVFTDRQTRMRIILDHFTRPERCLNPSHNHAESI